MRHGVTNLCATAQAEPDRQTNQSHTNQLQDMALQVLEILNKQSSAIDTVCDILLTLKQQTEIEAVGIRLKDGEDYPYYETSGYPEEFVKVEMNLCEDEMNLCEDDEKDKVINDTNDTPCLECICGKVIRGRTNPDFPFFTEGGSFWSNGMSKLLANTSEEDRQVRTRNRCNSEGYESIALIPLRSDEETIGLLQLNDRRPNMLTIEDIEFYEKLGNSIGIAVERKTIREKLRESENRRAAFMDSATDAFCVVDREFRITEINRTALQVLLETRDDIECKADVIGIYLFNAYPFLKKNRLDKKLEDILVTGQPYLWENTATHKIHGILHYAAKAFKVDDGLGFVVTDITERKQAEVMLKEQEEELKTIFDSVPALIFYKDKNNCMIRVNKTLENIIGLPKEQIEGKSAYEFFPEQAKRSSPNDLIVINSGIPIRNIVEPMIVDGNEIWVQTDKIPYRDSSGNTIGIIGFSQDITKQKMFESGLKQKSIELEERVKELNCLYSISQLILNRDLPISEVVQSVVEIIPTGYKHPIITCARIVLGDMIFSARDFVETKWQQSAEILISDEIVGKVEVGYKEEVGEAENPFIPEERSLIETLSKTIGLFIENRRSNDNLNTINLKLVAEQQALHDSNIALKEVLKSIEEEQKGQLISVQSHINRTVLPLVKKLKMGASDFQSSYISMIIDNLDTITSPFVGKLESRFVKLSPREVEICKMLKEGMTTKDIADTLNISPGTVFNQRKTIRKKLGIASDKTNLMSFLKSI